MKHGRVSTYLRARCRCNRCRRAASDYYGPRNRALRAERRKAGRCPRCGGRRAAGYVRCAPCRQSQLQQRRFRRLAITE